jgi:hypothetical protein
MKYHTPSSVLFVGLLAATFLFTSCKKDEPDPLPTTDPGPALVFKFTFNPDGQRLNSFGQPAEMPDGNAGQSPQFNKISAHYFELAQTGWTALGTGEVLYMGPETNAGGDAALDFNQAIVKGGDEEFLRIPLANISPGTYEWIRVSLAYQNYNINYRWNGIDFSGTLASFIGFNTYISSYQINNESLTVNGNRLQGYWGFETYIPGWGNETSYGQAAAGATTVPNPLFGQSNVPEGSCVVTGPFNNPLTITGSETEDIEIILSLSTNQSFEWKDEIEDGFYEPLDVNFEPTGEIPVDMGVRGLEAIVVE